VPAKDGEPERNPLSKYLQYLYVGVQFFLSVAIFVGGGIWLDRRLGTKVLFTLLGLALGFGGGVYSLYREFFPGKSGPPRKPVNRKPEHNEQPAGEGED